MDHAEITIGSQVVIIADDDSVRYGRVIWRTHADYVEVRFYSGQIEWFAVKDVQLSNIQ